MAEFVNIAKVGEVAPGTCTVVEVRDRALALFNVGGELFVLDNTCKHRGGPLGEGELIGSTIVCPWHGHEYDVRTGECAHAGTRVASYKTRIHGDDVQVEL